MTKNNVVPFSNSAEFDFYIERNCYKCLKCLDNQHGVAEDGFHKGECNIYENIILANLDCGQISAEIAERMGYENNKLFPKCKEFVSDYFEYKIIAGSLF